MVPWRPPGIDPEPLNPPNHSTRSHASSSDSSSEEDPIPPPSYYFNRLREIYPSSTRRDGLRAWDLSINENYQTKGMKEEERVQGNVSKFQSVESGVRLILGSEGVEALIRVGELLEGQQEGGKGRGIKRSIEGRNLRDENSKGMGMGKGKGKEEPLFLSSDEEEDDVKVEEGGLAKKRKVEEVNGKEKGKGKAREVEELVLLDSDDDDDEDGDVIMIQEPSSSRSAKDKGKGKQPTPSHDTFPNQRPPSPALSPLAQLLQLLPDLLPSHAETLLASAEFGQDLDKITNHLFSISGGYPKVEKLDTTEKEKQQEKELDYLNLKERQRREGDKSSLYKRLALDQLYTNFPSLSTSLLKSTFQSLTIGSSYFAPTYLSIYTRLKAGEFNDKLLKGKRKPVKKSTRLERDELTGHVREVEERDEELEREMKWVRDRITKERKEKKEKESLEKEEQEEIERVERVNERARKKGRAKECQCCYDEVAEENTAACENGHLFCKSCCINNASHCIGDQKYDLKCMAGCGGSFDPENYKEWLPTKSREALEKLQAEKELEMAFEGVEGFEKCPYCPFAMYIENENERLFTCLNEKECGKVSCRKCHKEGHVPLTCEEADRDARMDGVHAVEDAMTEAFIRSCPNTKCGTRFFKGEACNKITCSKCGTLSCYICGKIVKDYTHFDQGPPGAARASTSKCPMFDDTEMRHFNEVEEARKKAQASLDSKTAEYAEKLAADKPNRPEPRFPAGGAAHAIPPPPLPQAYAYANAQAQAQAAANVQVNVNGFQVYPPIQAPPPVPRRRGRQARDVVAQQAAQLANMQYQQAIMLQQQIQIQHAVNGNNVNFAFNFGGPQPQPQPPVNDPAAARRARAEAALRRVNQG